MSLHYVSQHKMTEPYPDGFEQALFGMGCFWGAERLFWETPGVYVTASGYAGGDPAVTDYQSICQGNSGHAEVVLVVFDPAKISYQELLKIFWENHDPTQGHRQGNDIGEQYRSVIMTSSEQQADIAHASLDIFQKQLDLAGGNKITTEILPVDEFHFAEDYHQQYLAKNPGGYCGLRGTGVSCPINN